MSLHAKAQYDCSLLPVDIPPLAIESADDALITLYEDKFPPALELEMEKLYSNLFSSFARFRAYGNVEKINIFTIQKNGITLSIIAFVRSGKKIQILNEQIEFSQWEINKFSAHIFSYFDGVSVIEFKAINIDIRELNYPLNALHFTNDVIVSCSNSEQEYLSKLGKSTRQNVKHSLKFIKRDFPTFECQVHEKTECSRELFQEIIGFNRARMSEKGKVSGINLVEEGRIWEMLQSHGFVVAIFVDGKVCAGTISFRFDSNYFVRVNAHNSDFNEYGLGILACYLAICECIKRRGKEVHFLWGHEEYKFRLLGKERNFDTVKIYRTKFIFLFNGANILKDILFFRIRVMRIWISNPENSNKFMPKLAKGIRYALNRVRGRQQLI